MTKVFQWLNWSRWDKIWVAILLVTLLLRVFLPVHIIETWYTRGLYPVIRKLMEFMQRFAPVHWLWVFIFLLFTLIIWKSIRALRQKSSFFERVGKTLGFTLSLVAMVISLFMWCWGFNYGRVNLYQQLGIKGQPIALEQLNAFALDQQEKVIALRKATTTLPDSNARVGYVLPANMESEILRATKKTFYNLKLGVLANPKPKMLYPKGTLLRISTAGFYSPWTGEPNIDAGLHPLQIPFVMAHEVAHSMGITDEGGCNFLAVLIGRKMKDPILQYAFELSYWKYVMGKLRRADKDRYKKIRDQLPVSVANDLKNIRENSEQYPDIFPKLRNLFYDSYLKSQGVKEGMGSYQQVVNMVVAWEAKNNVGNN